MADKFDEFALEISKLAEYYEKPQGKWSVGIYWANLQFYSIDEVREAIRLHIREEGVGRFMPKVSELLPLLKMVHNQTLMREQLRLPSKVSVISPEQREKNKEHIQNLVERIGDGKKQQDR